MKIRRKFMYTAKKTALPPWCNVCDKPILRLQAVVEVESDWQISSVSSPKMHPWLVHQRCASLMTLEGDLNA